MLKYEEILEDDFSNLNKNKDGYFHKQLIRIKKAFKLINNEMDKLIREIDEKINNLDTHFQTRKNHLFH